MNDQLTLVQTEPAIATVFGDTGVALASVLAINSGACNGAMLAVDGTLLPPPATTAPTVIRPSFCKPGTSILARIRHVPAFDKFVNAIQKAKLDQLLRSVSFNFTLLAPENAAFRNASQTVNDLIDYEPMVNPCVTSEVKVDPKMEVLINSHVIQGSFTMHELKHGITITTLSGMRLNVREVGWPRDEIRLHYQDGVAAAVLVRQEISSCNGVVLVIDSVLEPFEDHPLTTAPVTSAPTADPSGSPSSAPTVAPTLPPTEEDLEPLSKAATRLSSPLLLFITHFALCCSSLR